MQPEKILLIPDVDLPHKRPHHIEPFHHRYAMCHMACAPYRYMTVCDCGAFCPQLNYTYDMLAHLATRYQEFKIFWLMGMDAYMTFHLWHRWSEFGKYAALLVAPRLGTNEDDCLRQQKALRSEGIETIFLSNANIRISSTKIRKDIYAGLHSTAVPGDVMRYIKENKLYSRQEPWELLNLHG